ncbi:hypothetical protein MFRU_014g01750 [Monilinia fructicola]|nr:hypothetical protein MFRU_014g01750 [Monilinia fructicola]
MACRAPEDVPILHFQCSNPLGPFPSVCPIPLLWCGLEHFSVAKHCLEQMRQMAKEVNKLCFWEGKDPAGSGMCVCVSSLQVSPGAVMTRGVKLFR